MPTLIVNGIKEIFVIDVDYVKDSTTDFADYIKTQFGVDTSVFENLFQNETPVEDVEMDYNIPYVGDFHLKVLDASFLKDGVEFFRPIIRGFIVLLLLFYHVKNLVGFFGYDAGVVSGRNEQIAEAKKGGK